MELQTLVDGFTGAGDRQAQLAAGKELAALGAPAVAPLVAVLCDESSAVDWSVTGVLLREIGRPALEPLADAIASAPTPEAARRAGWAYVGLKIDDLSAFAAHLRHPSPQVRDNSVHVLKGRGEAALPYAAELIELLVDPDAEVRQGALWALKGIGPGVVPLLREVRRSGGRLRRPALEALAAVGGPAALDQRDRDLVRRLVRIKIATEVPEPMHLCGSWFAIPTGDQAAVLDAFDLSGPEPVTMRLGESAWNHDQHGLGDDHSRCSRAYVSPRLDGWTLVFGAAHDDGGDQWDAVRDRCRALSRRFGGAHWYGMSCGDGWTGWCLAEDGEVVRFYENDDPDEQIGPRHSAEEGYLLFEEDDLSEESLDEEEPDLCYATVVAGRASTDPSSFGAHTRVEGHGVLALTSCGREHGQPRGALRI
ncbi:HEAT repeat domain-containing protein [Actinomadura sp. DC4]|uniref:HEAT repeat domain-containing protein n=1 Tax=Actinomadura sp. DC4 TaxID=3055069 RepID=UPI0025AFDF12|nr:HEAT repeat domain-containing protein [Actinomadura sp. DC4]MDN3357741.1 HEAT repeat domain-containing protein [Actinomadura sp. DC4]